MLALLAAGVADAQAPLPTNRPHFAFVVVGQTPELRGWTSEWVQAVVARSANDSTARMAPWRNVLGWLDTDAEPFEPAPPFRERLAASGPSETPTVADPAFYPADLRRPLPVTDLRALLRGGRLESFTQIVVTKGFTGYRLVATTVVRQDSSVVIRRSVRGRRLQSAAEQLAAEVSRVWRPAHSQSVAGTR
jgi:hypothetical protein